AAGADQLGVADEVAQQEVVPAARAGLDDASAPLDEDVLGPDPTALADVDHDVVVPQCRAGDVRLDAHRALQDRADVVHLERAELHRGSRASGVVVPDADLPAGEPTALDGKPVRVGVRVAQHDGGPGPVTRERVPVEAHTAGQPVDGDPGARALQVTHQ